MVCRNRRFQYGLKYWCLNTLVLCGAVLFSQLEQPGHLASWHPLFLVATVNVVFSEKVQQASPFCNIKPLSGCCVQCSLVCRNKHQDLCLCEHVLDTTVNEVFSEIYTPSCTFLVELEQWSTMQISGVIHSGVRSKCWSCSKGVYLVAITTVALLSL